MLTNERSLFMIPKKIHYCWLSDDPFPDIINKCIDSWRKMLPDYEIVKWDLQKFPLNKCKWVKEAFERRKFAFAADYIRLYALYKEGGIYLDSDVEVIKSFDDLLHLPYFICKENSHKGLEAATIGAEKGCTWIKTCLDYYDGKSFENEDGSFNTEVLPSILKSQISKNYNLVEVESVNQIYTDDHAVYVLPLDFFSPKSYVNKKIVLTNNTYSIHHFAGTWQPLWKKIILRVWVPFSAKYPNLSQKLKCVCKH